MSTDEGKTVKLSETIPPAPTPVVEEPSIKDGNGKQNEQTVNPPEEQEEEKTPFQKKVRESQDNYNKLLQDYVLTNEVEVAFVTDDKFTTNKKTYTFQKINGPAKRRLTRKWKGLQSGRNLDPIQQYEEEEDYYKDAAKIILQMTDDEYDHVEDDRILRVVIDSRMFKSVSTILN